MRANDNADTIECEVAEDREQPGRWLVEAVDHSSDGEVYQAAFSGPKAREKALAFAYAEYGHNGIVMACPLPPPPKRPPALRVITGDAEWKR